MLQLVHFEQMAVCRAFWPQRSSQLKPLRLVSVSHLPNFHDGRVLLAEHSW
jgi:hypothetical protein